MTQIDSEHGVWCPGRSPAGLDRKIGRNPWIPAWAAGQGRQRSDRRSVQGGALALGLEAVGMQYSLCHRIQCAAMTIASRWCSCGEQPASDQGGRLVSLDGAYARSRCTHARWESGSWYTANGEKAKRGEVERQSTFDGMTRSRIECWNRLHHLGTVFTAQ
jgi:hypothetical protein